MPHSARPRAAHTPRATRTLSGMPRPSTLPAAHRPRIQHPPSHPSAHPTAHQRIRPARQAITALITLRPAAPRGIVPMRMFARPIAHAIAIPQHPPAPTTPTSERVDSGWREEAPHNAMADTHIPHDSADSAYSASPSPTYQHLRIERRDAVAHVTLARPDVHNAFNARLIGELHHAFTTLRADDTLRAIVLAGDGPSFCAGADLTWMRASLDFTHDENIADAQRMADMYHTIDTCPHPIIGRIHGAALGGGAGLVAVCDIVIAAEDTRFGFTEARLGIAPAVISPFVLRKIGQSHARALFLTAERFDAARALAIGLIHHIAFPTELDAAVTATVQRLLLCGPQGVRAAKHMALTVPTLTAEQARHTTVATIASLRIGDEAQDGIRAFLEKRPARWVRDDV